MWQSNEGAVQLGAVVEIFIKYYHLACHFVDWQRSEDGLGDEEVRQGKVFTLTKWPAPSELHLSWFP